MVRELNSGRSIGGEIVSQLTALTSEKNLNNGCTTSCCCCYSRRREKGRGGNSLSQMIFRPIQTMCSLLLINMHHPSFSFSSSTQWRERDRVPVRFSDSTRPHLTIRNLNLSKKHTNKAEETRGLFKRTHKHKKYTKWQHI